MKNPSLTIGRKRRTGDEEVTWQPPENGWCKMNIEAVCTNASGTQLIRACGGLLRNHQGTFLQGFMMKTSEPVSDNTPSTSNNNLSNAQLWGCMLGLKIAWDSGIRMLVIETTNSTVTAIQKRAGHQAETGDLRMEMEIQQLLGRKWEVRVLVVKRESNLAAYNLAQNAISCMPGFHMLHSLPQHVHEVVLQEVPLTPENIKKTK